MPSKYDSLFDTPPLAEQASAVSPPPQADKYGALFDAPSAPLHSSLYEASGTNPDAEVRKAQLAKELDTPAGILPQDAEQQALMQKHPADELQQNSPATAKFLTNPDNAKATGLSGVQSLVDLEKAYKSYSPENIIAFIDTHSYGKSPAEAAQELTRMKAKGIDLNDYVKTNQQRDWGDVLPDTAKAGASGVNTMLAMFNELGRTGDPLRGLRAVVLNAISPRYAKQVEEANNAVGQGLNDNANYWLKEKSAGMQAKNEALNKADWAQSIGMLITDPALMVDQLTPSFPYLIPGAAAARGGTAGTLAYTALTEAADSANSARQAAIQAGRSPEEQDRAASTALLVTLPFVFLGNKFTGAAKLEARFFNEGTMGHSLVTSVIKEAVSGGIEEGSNQGGQNVAASEYNPLQSLSENILKMTAIGSLLESTHGAGMHAASTALDTYVKALGKVNDSISEHSTKAADALATHDTLETMGAQATENPLKGRSSEDFKQFVETMTEDTPLQDVYVAPETIKTLLDTNYTEINQSSPELLTSMQEGVDLQHDVRISVADYLTHIAGTPMEQTLLPELKAAPDGGTYKEAQDFYKNQAEMFQQQVASVDEASAEVLTEEKFNELKLEEATKVVVDTVAEAVGEPSITEPTQPAQSALPDTYAQYVAEHKNKREVYERDVKMVEDKLQTEFQQAKRFTSPINRAYVAPLVEFYKKHAKDFGVTPSEMYTKYPLRVQSFLGLMPTSELNQASPASIEDFRKENIKDLLTKGDWAILTAENPSNEHTPEKNPALMAQLEAQLTSKGVQHYEVAGHYGRPEKSLILFGVNPKKALEIGRQYGQESVLTKDGLIYQNGSRNPSTGEIDTYSNAPEDFYTTVTFPDGGKVHFTVGIDFDTKLEAGQMSPVPFEKVGKLEGEKTLFQQGKVGLVPTIIGVHYSTSERQTLSGAYYGRGIKGAEATRVQGARDSRLKSRLYFYVDEGKGVFPEYGVGSAKHTVTLSNMYDGARNPLKLPKKDANGEVDANVFESAVLDAGFDGYYIENGFGRQGVAVLLGEASRNVKPNDPNIVHQSSFYSALTRSLEGTKQAKGSTAQWKGIIKNLAGVKQAEIEATGIDDWLDLQEGSVTKEELLTYLNANGVQVTETILGNTFNQDDENTLAELEGRSPDELNAANNYGVQLDDTKYEAYSVPGGKNYKEVLLTLPTEDSKIIEERKALSALDANQPLTAEQQKRYDELRDLTEKGKATAFHTSHFDQANILAHVRFDERTDADGNRVLFINEIQSDWGQKGKKHGFKENVIGLTLKEQDDLAALENIPRGYLSSAEKAEIGRLLAIRVAHNNTTPPIGPFVTDTKAWVSLAFKRMLQYAADNNFAKIAIINGQQAADLYDLSKHIDRVEYTLNNDGTANFDAISPDEFSSVLSQDNATQEQVAEALGKDVAEQIFNDQGIEDEFFGEGVKAIMGDGLKVGGEGMKAFYDKLVPNIANDILKKLGAKVEPVEISHTVKASEPERTQYGWTVQINGSPITVSGGYPRKQAKQIAIDTYKRVNKDTIFEGKQLGVVMTPDLVAKVQSGLPLFQQTRGSFNLETLTMTLLQGADLSTVVHESGHFYLKMLQDLASRADAPEQIQADYKKTLEWFGVSPSVWQAMTLEEQRPYHEQWAESWERWNFEGVAPSQQLQPIFSRFRAWLTSVYKSVEDFVRLHPASGKLNDEVRGVFSRLLASEEAIAASQAARAYQPLFTSAKEAGVSETAFAEYINLGQEATQDAVDELQARSMRDMKWLTNARNAALRKLQALAKVTRHEVETQVTKAVMLEPINQARSFLRTGKMTDPNTGEAIEAFKGYKLDKAVLAEMYPESALDSPDLGKLRGMTSDEGLAPDLVANIFGFSSGDALVRELIEGENAKDKIEGLTDQRMLEEHGELTDQKSIEQAANEAVHNEARAKFMATGLKMLTKAPISVTQLTKAAKNAAEATIGGKRVRDIKPKQYLAAETRANKAVLQTLPKDPTAAAEAQRAALLNNRLAASAQEALTEVEKALKFLGKFNNEGTRKNLDVDYLEQIDALLEPFDLRKGLSLSTVDANTSLAEWVAQQEAMGFEPTIDPAEVARVSQKSYKNMTMSELRGLVDTIKQVEHMGRMKKKLLTALERADFLERIAEAKLSIALNANRSVKDKGTPSDVVGILGQWARQMTAAHRKFSSYMRELDGGKNNGVMFNLLMRSMFKAANTESEMKADASEKLATLFEGIKTKISSIGNIYNRKVLIPGTSISMNNEERIMFGMNWGNEGNRQRLMDGGLTGKKALSPQEARAILDTLTKDEWDFIQNTLDFIATFKPLIEAQERALTGKTPEWVEPAEIQTKYGVYRGGYFPAKYDAVLATRSESFEAAADLRSAMKGAFGSASARNGYTKARAAQVVGRPLLLNFSTISRHVNEVIHRLAWQETLIDSGRVLRALDGDLRTTIGAEGAKELRDTISDIASGDAPASSPVEVALNRIRTGTSIVGMGWKISTALMQPIGLTGSFARVGGRYMARGLARYLANSIAAGDWVNDNSALMRNRGRTMNREMSEILNTVRAGKQHSTLTASYFYLIGKLQRTVDIPTYIGAYERSLEEQGYESAGSETERKKIEALAHDIAGQTVKETQGGGELLDQAKVQRGSPIFKLFTNFYSYMSTVYNMNVENYRTTNFKSPSEFGVFVANTILINIVPAVLTVALKNVLKGQCAWDDSECLVNRYKSEQVSNLFGQMLLLREVGVAADAATGGESYGYSGPAGLRFFADLYKTTQQAVQGEMDMPFFKAANNALGALFHYPAGQINNTLDGAIAIEEGRVDGAAIIPALIAGAPK